MRFLVLETSGTRHNTGADTEFIDDFGETRVGDAPTCPRCGEFVGMLKWLPPYRVTLETWDRRYGDLAFGPGGDQLLVSERFRDLWFEHKLTGLSDFEPVKVMRVKTHKRMKDQTVPRYYCVSVLRSETAVDTKRSRIEWRRAPSCPYCLQGYDLLRWDGVVIDEATWSGEDLFLARGMPATWFASERFRDFCHEHKIGNAVLTPGEDYEHDFRPWENWKRMEELARMPVGGPLEEKTKPNGEIWRYFRPRNELLIINPDGSIQGMSRPLDGPSYWRSQ